MRKGRQGTNNKGIRWSPEEEDEEGKARGGEEGGRERGKLRIL